MGTDREVLDRIQRGFGYQYNAYGRLKKENISSLDYNNMQTWRRIQRHVIVDGYGLV